jgi:hypothetical protein
MFAAQHFRVSLQEVYSNDFSFAVGGPGFRTIFLHFSAEPRCGSNAAGGQVTFADPDLTSFLIPPTVCPIQSGRTFRQRIADGSQ